jgi:hypothetical protein
MKVFAAAFVALLLSGCGLGETAASSAAGGASAVEQAKEGRAMEARVQQQLDDAARQSAQQREAAEKDTQ